MYEEWKKKYIKEFGNMYYVKSQDTHDTSGILCVSEAIGYGMLISVLSEDYPVFHKLLSFYERFQNGNGLMSWRISNGGIVKGSDKNSATDGDLDAAYSLFLMYEKTENGRYLNKGMNISNSLLAHCVNKEIYHLLLGDWVSPNNEYYYNVTRPSDFCLTHLLKFSEYNCDWIKVLNKCIDITSEYSDYGLLPDFVRSTSKGYVAVKPNFLESDKDGNYNWNSCRTPWRIGVYYLNTKDSRIKNFVESLYIFYKKQDGRIKGGYDLEGNAIVTYETNAFKYPFNVILKIFNKDEIPITMSGNYYEDTIGMLVKLQSNIIKDKPKIIKNIIINFK